MKLSFIIGNANQGYMTRMCIYSLMKYNKEYIDEIVIADNSSTDYSIQFFEENKYKDITKIITYDNARDRNPRIWYPHGMQWDLGLNTCKNDYALLCHADVEWKADYIGEFLKNGIKQNPFLYGFGGDGSIESLKYYTSRIHEWGMIIHVPTWKQLGVSFEGANGYRNNDYDKNNWVVENLDTSTILYRKAVLNGLKIVSIGYGPGIEDNWMTHYCGGGKDRKEIITEIARKYND